MIAEKATGSQLPDELTAFGLPKGYRYLVDEEQGCVIEPALMFLCDTYPPIRGRWVETTVSNCAYDLVDWWRFIQHNKKEWDGVDQQDLTDYRDSMLNIISPRTHREYDTSTINRRLDTVCLLYEWADREGYYKGDLHKKSVHCRAVRTAGSDAFLHLHSNESSKSFSRVRLKPNRGDGDTIRPLNNDKWNRAIQCLGPLPSERQDNPKPSRDRLACELALWCGPRVSEVAALTVNQIMELKYDLNKPLSAVPLKLVKTKGMRRRTILLPNHLLHELRIYIENERRQSIAVGRMHKKISNSSDPSSLFVNGVAARNRAGQPVTATTLSDAFRSALIASGITRTELLKDPESGASYEVKVAEHSFHDLRHTFAVWMYDAERRAGNSEPWKKIQVLLGHRQLATTLKTYLRVVEIDRLIANEAVYHYFKNVIANAS